MNTSLLRVLVTLSPWWLVGCGEAAPSATPAAPTSHTTNQSPAPAPDVVAAEAIDQEPAEPVRPDLLLTVEGSDVDGVLFRGWPWRIQVEALRGDAPTTLRIEGATEVAATDVGGSWVVTEALTAKVPVGPLVFLAGAARLEVQVVDAPATSTSSQTAVKRRLALWCALAGKDPVAARTIADAWVAAEPDSAAARTALGNVLQAAGDRAGALAAYSEAVVRVPEGMHPPAVLHRRYGELLREQAAAALAAAPPATGSAGPVAAPAPSAPGAAAAAPPGEIVPASEWTDAQGLAATDGQWALRATASSQYSAPQYAATQATGAPDVKVAGDAPEAWCPGANDDGQATLELEFATIAAATGVRVRQNAGPGAITKVEAIAGDGSVHVWWLGRDPLPPTAARDFAWFVVRVPATPYEVARLRLTLDLAGVAGWNQIDAVQLVGTR
jgi:hypothetical protein